MTVPREIFSDADFRRPLIMLCAAAAVWVGVIVVLSMTISYARLANADISSSGMVLDYAMQFRALPRTGNAVQAPAEEPLGALSQIVDTLGLRDRMRQLQSNPSGIVVQLEKLYGGELRELLYSLENRGLVVKTGELRALPGEDGKILNVTLMMEGFR